MDDKLPEIIEKKQVTFPFLDRPVEIYTLENGHKIAFAHKEGDLVNVSTWVRTGSINENDVNNGISHFLEHLMFKGTPKHPAGEFDRLLESKGAIVNAATWKDYTFYYVTLPKGENNEFFKQALELHADMMLNPLLPEYEIGPVFDFNNPDVQEKRERYVVIEEIRMRDDQPWTKTYNELNHLMYLEHPYRRDVIGTGEIIASVPRDTIYNYYETWYSPNNMITIIVGDLDSDEVINQARKDFNFNGRKKGPEPVIAEEPPQTNPMFIENTSNINTGFMMFGFHGPKARNLKDSIALDVIGIILGEGRSSRLYQNLIEKPETPVFNIVGADQYQFKDGNTFFVQANFHPSQKEKALELIRNELRNIADFPVSEAEFNKAKKKLKARFAEDTETVSEIGETIGYYMVVCGNLASCIDYLDVLELLTIKDIQEVASNYLDLNKSTISVLMPNATS